MLSLNIIIRLLFLLFPKRDSSWRMLRLLIAWSLSLWKLCWFSGFLLFTTGGLLFRFMWDNSDFLFWRFAVWTWPIWPTSSMLISLTVRWLNRFDVLIWKSMSLPSFTGFFRFKRHFVKESLICLNSCYLYFGSYTSAGKNVYIFTRIIRVFC